MQLKTVNAGDILMEENDSARGFHVVINGQLSKHFTLKGRIGHGLKQKVKRTSTLTMIMDENYPKYMNRKLQRLDSMDFSPTAMFKDIQKALKKNKNKASRVVPSKLATM